MRLVEAEGKALLQEFGIPVPASVLLEESVVLAEAPFAETVLKPQLLQGGRGRAGWVQMTTGETFPARLAALRSELARLPGSPPILAEERIEALAEYYLAVRIDDALRCPVLLFSTSGGSEVE